MLRCQRLKAAKMGGSESSGRGVEGSEASEPRESRRACGGG
jgi:hypothetical protein